MKPADFIARIAPAAVADMQRTGIPASLTIAQAILESAWGDSGLTRLANNLFGIKGTGPAGSRTFPTKEYINGQWVTVQAAFRVYNAWSESIADHSALILNGTKDKPKRYHGVLGADYKTACQEIWRGGYATDPNYPGKLIGLIEDYGLWKFDEEGDEELKEEVRKLSAKVDQLQGQVDALVALQHMKAVPDWAKDAVQAAMQKSGKDGKPVLAESTGSYNFHRVMTVLNRLGLFENER